MAKRKRIKVDEKQFDVITKPKNTFQAGGEEQTVTTINAANPNDALTKATAGDAMMDDKDVVIKPKNKLVQNRIKATGMQGSQHMEAKQPKWKSNKLIEGYNAGKVDYPYSIMLPSGFRSLFEGKNTKVSEKNGKIYVVVENEKDMDKLMAKLVKNDKDGKARVVINGIMESLR